MKIELTDIKDQTDWAYLDQNPDFAKQLLVTLNQVAGFSPNKLLFVADSNYWTYDYWISPNYEIKKDTFLISNDQMQIRSTNRDDLLNVRYYQELNDLATKDLIDNKWKWCYFAQDQVIQYSIINIKLTKPIDQYNQKQINAIGKLMTNVSDLIFKDYKWDWKQVDEQWKQGYDQDDVEDVGIVFDLNDFANPKILVWRYDENYNNHYENDYLKPILKADAPLLKFLNEFDFATHFQPYQSKVNKFFKKFLDE